MMPYGGGGVDPWRRRRRARLLEEDSMGGQASMAVTFNPADKSAGVALSGGNLIATPGSGSYNGVRVTAALPAGSKRICALRTNTVNLVASGICEATQSIGADLSASADTNTFWIRFGTASVYKGTGYLADAPADPVATAHIVWAVDLTLNKAWVGSTTAGSTTVTWHAGGDPATNTGGFAITAGLNYFFSAWFRQDGSPVGELRPAFPVPAGLVSSGYRNLNGGT